MGHTMIDSVMYQNFVGTPRAREIWSDENMVNQYFKIWASLAQAQEEHGIIPKGVADEIREKGKAENFDLAKMGVRMEEIFHPVSPIYEALSKVCSENVGKFIHWGATTQDISDTGFILQMKETAEYHEELIVGILKKMLKLAEEHKNSVMPGRTHQMHAVPITFGQKCATYADELSRSLIRLRESKDRILKGQFAGGASNLASLYVDGHDGEAVRNRYCELLGLSAPTAPWHNARDNMAEWAANLNTMCGTISRICYDLAGLHKQEVGEIAEDMFEGRVCSSTMPQKRNPDNIETLMGWAWIVNSMSNLAWNAQHVQHERCSACMEVDWFYTPIINIVSSFILENFDWLLDTIHIYPEKMKANLDITNGGIMAEAMMIKLGHKIGRLEAHEIITEASAKAFESNRHLLEILLEDDRLTDHYTKEELTEAFDPLSYTGEANKIVENVLKTVGALL